IEPDPSSRPKTEPAIDRPPGEGHLAHHAPLFRTPPRTDRTLAGGPAARPGQPARPAALLLAFRAADPGAGAGAVRHRLSCRDQRRRDPGLDRLDRFSG